MVVNFRIIFLQIKSHRRTNIAESFAKFTAYNKKDIDGIHALKVIFFKNDLKILAFKFQ